MIIGGHLRGVNSPCRVLVTPGVIPRLNAGQNVRLPDLGVTCVPDVAKTIATPDPLILVEILSPSNKAATWGNIWACSTVPTLREILVVQSTRIEVQVMRRASDGTWPQAATLSGPNEVFGLDAIDLVRRVDDVYADTHLRRR